MTRSILIQLGSETTEMHCGNCPHWGIGIAHDYCDLFGDVPLLSADTGAYRTEGCINAEDDLRRHL